MAKISIELTKESQKNLEALARAGKVDLRPAFGIIGHSYRNEVEMIFAHQQPRDAGLRWAPLSPKYAAWKERHFPGMQLLVRTGRLVGSMIDMTHRDNINQGTPISAIFGSKVPYGKFHDLGTRKMPKRNFSEPSERRMEIFRTQIEDHLVHVFEQNGFKVKKGFVK
jgi:phage gpG-like protein